MCSLPENVHPMGVEPHRVLLRIYGAILQVTPTDLHVTCEMDQLLKHYAKLS